MAGVDLSTAAVRKENVRALTQKLTICRTFQSVLAINSHFFIAMVEGRGQNVQLKQNGFGVNTTFTGIVGQLSSLLFRHENGALMQPNVAQYTNIYKYHKQLLHFTIHK